MSTAARASASGSAQKSRRNVIIYGLVIVLLFGLMYPYSTWLQQVKEEKDLGEATIGQVDTGSVMLKLALLGGARGVVANVLWMRANDLQRVQDWDRLAATVDLITKLQPHFLSIWTFQGWNLAYNVSVEWDSPADKYDWIKQGIQFLKQGVAKNQRSPDLLWDTAWTYYHKIGFADEAIILRRLFRDDDDEAFKTEPIENAVRHDNFLLGWGWFTRAVNLVDQGGTRLAGGTAETPVAYVDAPAQRKGRPDDLSFRTMPAHAQTRYAAALEKQSIVDVPATFGEVARNEWAKSLAEWVKFGKFPFPAWSKQEEMVYLDDSTNPEKMATLSKDQQYWTDRWGSQINYPYWKDRCSAEMEPNGVRARQLFYEGTRSFLDGDLLAADSKYSEGLRLWDEVLGRHRAYRDDQLNQKDTGQVVKRYVRILRNLGRPVPEDLPFLDLLKLVEQDTSVDPFDALQVKHASPAEAAIQ